MVAALARTGGFGDAAAELVAPCLPSKRQWGYRNKLELGAQWDAKGTFNLGFHQEGSPDVMQALSCPLAHDAIAKAPKALRGALRYLQGSDDLGIFRVGVRTSVRTRETEIALWTRPSGFPRAAAAKMLKSSLKATSVVRVIADPGKARKIKGLEVLDGKGCWQEQLLGARYVAHAPSFFQVNTAQAEKLMEQAIRMLGGSVGEDGPEGLDGLLVADLYAGCGTFGVAMARAGADVIAVESAASSVRDLRRNADETYVDIDVIGGDAARELPELGGLDALVVVAARGPCRWRTGRHRRCPPGTRGLRKLQPRNLGARRAPLRGRGLSLGARSARRPVPADLPRGAGQLLRARAKHQRGCAGAGRAMPAQRREAGRTRAASRGAWRMRGRLARAEGC